MKDFLEERNKGHYEIFNSRRVPWASINSHHREFREAFLYLKEDVCKELRNVDKVAMVVVLG